MLRAMRIEEDRETTAKPLFCECCGRQIGKVSFFRDGLYYDSITCVEKAIWKAIEE